MEDKREYIEHYVAFIDVLGFKDYLEKDVPCEEVFSVFESLRNNSHSSLSINSKEIEAFDDVRHYIMSDSIVLYIRSDIQNAFLALVSTCLRLQISLLYREKPVLLRGGIAKGDLYVDKDIIFGKGLSSAYMIENTISVVPRIVFNQALLDDGKQTSTALKGNLWDRMVTKMDVDELYFVHYLSPAHVYDINAITEYYDGILTLCQKYLNTTYSKSLREKYLWLKNYVIHESKEQIALIRSLQGGVEYLQKWKIAGSHNL